MPDVKLSRDVPGARAVGGGTDAGHCPHPFDLCESPVPLPLKVLLAPVLLLVVPLLFVFRVLLFLWTMLMLWLVCEAALLGVPEGQQPGPIRRAIYLPCVRLLGRCWPGMLRVSGFPDPDAPVWVCAPHTGIADPYLFLALGAPRPVMIASYAKLPVLGAVLRATGALLVPISSSRTQTDRTAASEEASLRRKAATATAAAAVVETDAGAKPPSAAIRDAIVASKEAYSAASESSPAAGLARVPLCIFPEGITHAGNCLLPFFSGAFEGGSPVQPVVLRMPFHYFNSAAFLSSLGLHFARLLVSPYLRIHVSFLPTYLSAEETGPDDMAAAVRERMAVAAGLPMSPIGAKGLRAEIKAKAKKAKMDGAVRATGML